MKIKVKDPIIKKVVKKFVDRSNVGFKKYRVTLDEDPGEMDTWLNHLQEELMDAVNYIERAREELKRREDFLKANELDVVDPVIVHTLFPSYKPPCRTPSEQWTITCTSDDLRESDD